jgi:multisubunit Na+/H+ antiporter MnhG subunit
MDITLNSFHDFSPDFLLRFALNAITVVILTRFLCFPNSQNRDLIFSHTMLGIMIFVLAFFMNGIKLSLGFAFGIFAVFGILRFRADAVGIKDMAYMFIIIASAMINALTKFPYLEVMLLNALIVAVTAAAQSRLMVRPTYNKLIEYEKIELIQPERRTELFADLEKRTGLNIVRVEIGDLDFLKDIATIRVFHLQPDIRLRGSNLALHARDSELRGATSNSGRR